MFPLCTKSGGQLFAFPDVCKVPAPPAPPVPTPFPNLGMCNQADGGTCTSKVKVQNQPVITVASEIPSTQGDEAGVAGGVSSGTQMSKAVFKQGVSKVNLRVMMWLLSSKPTAQNGSSANAPSGSVLAPGQTLVMING